MIQERINVVQQERTMIVELEDTEILSEEVIREISESLIPLVEKQEPLKLILSFVKVRRISSLALGTFIRLNRRIEARGGSLKLCSLSPQVKEMFLMTKLDRIFEMFPDEKSALKVIAS